MLTPLLATQTPSFSFEGGKAPDLIRTLVLHHATPAVIFADPSYRFKPVAGIPRSLLTGKTLAEATESLSFGSTLALGAKELPAGFLVRLGYDDYQDAFKRRASIRRENDRVIVEGPSCWVKVDDLLKLRYGRPVACHWLYRTAFVAITPGAFEEEPLLHTVADALGAAWSVNANGYHLDFDPKAHRERAIATYRSPVWQMPESEIPGRKTTFALAAESVEDKTWKTAYLSPEGYAIQGDIEQSSAVAASGMRLLEFLENNAKQTGQEESYLAIHKTLSRIDRKKKIRIRARADGTPSVDFPLTDERTTWTGV